MTRDWAQPPDWRKPRPDLPALVSDPQVRRFVERVNAAYLPWHEARYRAGAAGLQAEDAWAAVKLSRVASSREFPLLDTRGQPFSFWVPPEGQRRLMWIDTHCRGTLAQEAPTILRDEEPRYVVSSLMEEAIASSQIEGAATTRRVAKEMLRRGQEPRNVSDLMILNNYHTVQRLRDWSQRPLTPSMLLELHAGMTEGTLESNEMCGRFRKPDEEVYVVDPATAKRLHTPPPAAELPARTQAMCDFANSDDEEAFVHPVVKAILLHFWLGYDHPFVDGNGRTARALFYWLLLRKGYRMIEFVSISRTILRARTTYARAFLWSERDERDATYFLMFHLEKLQQAVEDLYGYVGRKAQETMELRRELPGVRGLNTRQRALLEHAWKNPHAVYTIESHGRCHDVSYATARADLLDLADRGLLVQSREGRRFVFTPDPDLAGRLRAGTSA